MTFDDFDAMFTNLVAEEHKIMLTKGKEYANSTDRLDNFKRMAAKRGVTPLVAAALLLDKHLDAIDYAVKHPEEEKAETFESRIVDARNYLVLMLAIFLEETQP